MMPTANIFRHKPWACDCWSDWGTKTSVRHLGKHGQCCQSNGEHWRTWKNPGKSSPGETCAQWRWGSLGCQVCQGILATKFWRETRPCRPISLRPRHSRFLSSEDLCFFPFQVTEETCTILQGLGYSCECRGLINVKGKGELRTYFVCTDTAKFQGLGLNWGLLVGARHAGNPFPSLKQARRKAQPHTRHKGSPRGWSSPPEQVAVCAWPPWTCTRGRVSLGQSPGLTHRQPEPLCCPSLQGGLQASREQLICGPCTHPQGAVEETLEHDLETCLPHPPRPVTCTRGTCLFSSRMGGSAFLPQHTSYKSTHFSYRHSGKWSWKIVLHLQMGSINREKAPQWTLTSYPLWHVSV